MGDSDTSVTSTTPIEADTNKVTTEVLATYFVVATVIFGILLFIGVKKLAQLCCFASVFHRPKNEEKDAQYNPHTPVPGLLYQLQMAYDKKHGSTHVQPVSRVGSQSSLLQGASQASSRRSSNAYRSPKHSSNSGDNRASKASDVTVPIDDIESAPTPAHYENLPVEVEVIKQDTASVTDSETQTNATSTATPETESLNECGATDNSDSAPPGGVRRYKKNTTAASSRPTSRGIPSKVRGSLEHS